MRLSLIAALLLALASPIANADTTGNAWKESCDQQNDAYEVGVCLGQVLGEVDGLTTGLWIGASTAPFCIPTGVTNGQIKDVAYKYVTDHPENRQLRLSVLVTSALIAAFPRSKSGCPTDPPPFQRNNSN
jgi:Rap1a immunity proteins